MKNEDEKELLKIKRVFSPKYILTEKLAEVYLFFALLIGICIAMRRIGYAVFMVFVAVLIIFLKLVFEKRKSNQSYMKFYKDRVEFKGKVFLFKIEKRVLEYSEIKDITVTQGASLFEKMFQKKFGYGNLYVYPKKGNLITRRNAVRTYRKYIWKS